MSLGPTIKRTHTRYHPYNIYKLNSYIAQYLIIRIAESALHFIAWQTCSIGHHLGFSGKHPATLQLMSEDYSYHHQYL